MDNNQNNDQYNKNNNNSQNYNPNYNNPNNSNPGGYNSNYNTYNNAPGQQPYNPNFNHPYDPTYETMTFKDWLIPQLLLLIPIANLILPFVWAFGNNVNKNKKAYFQAHLVIMLIRFVLSIFIMIAYIGVALAIFGSVSGGNNL